MNSGMIAATYPMATVGGTSYGSGGVIPVTCAPAPTTCLPGLPQICTWEFLKSICKPIGPAPNPLTTNGIIRINESSKATNVTSEPKIANSKIETATVDTKPKTANEKCPKRSKKNRNRRGTAGKRPKQFQKSKSIDEQLIPNNKENNPAWNNKSGGDKLVKVDSVKSGKVEPLSQIPKIPQLTPEVLSGKYFI